MDHSFCDDGKVLREHGEDLAVVTAKVEELERAKLALFKVTKEIGDASLENQFIGKELQRKMASGELTKPIERKIDTLCNEFTQTRYRFEEHTKAMTSRVEKLEQSSWITDLLGLGIKKLVVTALLAAMVLGLVNTAWWGLAKNFIFKEAPKQQQYLFLKTKEGQHPVLSTTPIPDGVPVPVQDDSNNNGGGKNRK